MKKRGEKSGEAEQGGAGEVAAGGRQRMINNSPLWKSEVGID